MYLYYLYRDFERFIKSLPHDKQALFKLERLLINDKLNKDVYVLPLQSELLELKDEAAVWKQYEFLGIQAEMLPISAFIHAGDFSALPANYTNAFVLKNISGFTYDGIGQMEYNPDAIRDIASLRFCCGCVGDAEERIADAFKLLEILLMLVSDTISETEKAEIKNLVKQTTMDEFVVNKKYNSPGNFVKVFLERQAKIRKILDKKLS